MLTSAGLSQSVPIAGTPSSPANPIPFCGVEDTHLVINQDILPSRIPLRDIGQFLFLVHLNQDIPLCRVGKPRSLNLLEHFVHGLGSFLPAWSSVGRAYETPCPPTPIRPGGAELNTCILFRSIQHNDA